MKIQHVAYGSLATLALLASVAVFSNPSLADSKKKPACEEAKQDKAEEAKAAAAPADEMSKLEKDFRQATALLYVQLEDGSMRMMCTATAFEKKGDLTYFVSAAHCLSEDDEDHDRVNVSQAGWYVTFDDPDNKSFTQAKIVGAGYQHRGDDFAVLEVKLPKEVPVIPLAADDPSLGEELSNFASPGGFGKQLFRGHVSMEKLDRPMIEGDINWKGSTLLQTLSGPGSSGSAVISKKQRGIMAFIVGRISGSPSVVSIPVSKFKAFWTDVQAGKYKWYKPTDDGTSGAKSVQTQRLIKTVQSRFPDGSWPEPIKAEK
jgi:hypothetical protein